MSSIENNQCPEFILLYCGILFKQISTCKRGVILTAFSSSSDSFIETFYYQDSDEKVNSSSFLPRSLATIKSFNDKNEAIELVEEDDIKRKIEDARNFLETKDLS